MLYQRLIPIQDPDAWIKELEHFPHPPALSWHYNDIMMQYSKLPTYLYTANAPHFKACCPISMREKHGKNDVVTPYGFGGMTMQGFCPDFSSHYRQFFTENDFVCGYLALHPLFCQSQHFQEKELHLGLPIYILDLRNSLEDVLLKFSKVHRYELRTWQAQSFEIVTDSTRIKEALPRLYQETLSRVNASAVYHFSSETLMNLIDLNSVLALGVAENHQLEAISLFLFNSHMSDYFLNASSHIGRQHTRGLIWAAIQALKKLAAPFLNLGGGVQLNDHLDDFKRRFGGNLYQCHVLKDVYQEALFKELCEKTLSLNNARRYFPPYHH